MIPWTLLLDIMVAASLLMVILWVIAYRTSDAGIVDVGWAFGMAGTALYLGLFGQGEALRRILVTTLISIWALRLGGYLLINRVLGESCQEDGRYQQMRAALGRKAHWGFFLFFQVQALFILLFAIPLLIPFSNPAPLDLADWIGAGIWAIAVWGESRADWQLANFRENPNNRGKTCQEGLWRYSRHPNYFFEWLHWFAYPFLSWGAPYFWVVCLAPLMMLVFLIKITGIPFTEKQALQNRADYADYQKTTSMFIPWFPKRS